VVLLRATEAPWLTAEDVTDAQIIGLGRLILGSVAESVLRGTTTPILLLRAEGAAVLAPGGTAERMEASHARA